jgi:hypothetical protein
MYEMKAVQPFTMLKKCLSPMMFAMLTLPLVACGGGGGSDSDPAMPPVDPGPSPSVPVVPGGSGNDQEITGDQFTDLVSAAGSGVWRVTSSVISTYTTSTGSAPIDVVTDSKSIQVTAYSRGGNVETYEICDGNGPRPIQPPPVDDGNYCAGVSADPGRIQYLRLDDGHLRVNTYCDGKLYSNTEFEKINTAATFDLGSLALTSSTYPSANTDAEVCGSLTYIDTKANSTQTGPIIDTLNQTFSQITVVAPYGSSFVNLDMKLHRKDIVVGTYTVTQTILHAADTMVSVSLRSPEFGGSVDDPDFIFPRSGTVTIDSVSAYAVSGTVDLVLRGGDHISGNFSINLQ